MGAWYCEADGCHAVIPGAHPVEQGAPDWDANDPLLCRACTAELAFEIIEQWVADRLKADADPAAHGGPLRGAKMELEWLREQLPQARRDLDRAETFNPTT